MFPLLRTGSSQIPGGAEAAPRAEALWAVALITLGLVPRLFFVILFPTEPISDFRSLVDFGIALRDTTWAENAWPWQYLSAGLPSALAPLFALMPGPPEAIARFATAILTGLVPLLPFLLWRGTLSLTTRGVTGILLALWPGQALFSGAVAQDNWVMAPTIALGALAVRALVRGDRAFPVASALLLGLGTWIRQEMLIALLPLSAAAATAGFRRRRLAARLGAWAVVLGLSLSAVAAQRWMGTGRFGLTSDHGGLSMLGAYAPGAGSNRWVDPRPFMHSKGFHDDGDVRLLNREAYRLSLQEALRRPAFHLARVVGGVISCWHFADTYSLYWSIGAPGVLPGAAAQRAKVLLSRGSLLPVKWWLDVVHVLFLAALILAMARRSSAIWVLAASILLKVSIHAVFVSQPRYFLPVVALEVLAVGVALEIGREAPRARLAFGLAGAILLGLALSSAGTAADRYLAHHDEPPVLANGLELDELSSRASAGDARWKGNGPRRSGGTP